MPHETNPLGQPIGLLVADWKPPIIPPREVMQGTFCRLVPLNVELHGRSLFDANALDAENRNWTYLPYGPFESFEHYMVWLHEAAKKNDALFFTIIDKTTEKPVGLASYVNILQHRGIIEVGHLNFSPLLQEKPTATEAMFLMMKNVFELGYRRYEWKCNALNAPSRRAAQRLGFSYEGILRQANVLKGRNRDTASYATIDQEWPELQSAFLRWLSPSNFDERGVQKTALSKLTAPTLKNIG